MIYSFPDYYREFSCVADQCEDTCCAGWQIVIDPKSMHNYKKIKGPFKPRVLRSIHWMQGTFRQDRDLKCAFLNDENLCDLYTHAGAASLCKTCRNYPRHIEEFENIREISLSVSCPEVAKILLAKSDPVTFVQYENEKEEEYADFDFFLHSELTEAREQILSILQDRSLEIPVRAALFYGIAHDMQRRINHQELFSCQEVYEKYQKKEARNYVRKEVEAFFTQGDIHYQTMQNLWQQFYGLEVLKKEWTLTMLECKDILYADGNIAYKQRIHDFSQWTKNYPMWDIWMEQLLVYFLTTYFCGAVYDGEVFAKAHMALTSLAMIHELAMARWSKNGQTFDEIDMKEVIYRFSREVEHSDPNLNALERIRFYR